MIAPPNDRDFGLLQKSNHCCLTGTDLRDRHRGNPRFPVRFASDRRAQCASCRSATKRPSLDPLTASPVNVAGAAHTLPHVETARAFHLQTQCRKPENTDSR